MKLALASFCAAMALAGSASAQLAATPTGSIGVFRNGVWWLDLNRNYVLDDPPGGAFGQQGDRPLVLAPAPRCSNNGTVYAQLVAERPTNTTFNWYLTKNNLYWDDPPDSLNTFTFLDGPVASWNGVPVAYFNARFWVDWNGNHRWDEGVDQTFPFGQAGDIPVFGIWQPGAPPRMGTFRNVNGFGYWFLDYNGTNKWDQGDTQHWFGLGTDIPVVMPFSDGVDRMVAFRNGTWLVDADNNGTFVDPPGGKDYKWTYGQAGDIPVVTRVAWKSEGPCP